MSLPYSDPHIHSHERTHDRRVDCEDCPRHEDFDKLIKTVEHFEGPTEHLAHVLYVREMIERRKRREALIDRIFQTTIGNMVWVVIVGLGLLGYNLLKYVVAYAAKTGKLPGS